MDDVGGRADHRGGVPPAVRRAWTWASRPWGALLLATVTVIVVQKLVALGSVPPGLYSDEASIGYNAWAIAHHGVDEHGARFPLYFEAFGEYKNPLYVYALAPLTWFLPLTAATIRLPAALCGIGVCLFTAGTAWTVTRSRAVTWVALASAELCPWLLLQSRVGFEVSTMTLCLAAFVFAYARSRVPGSGRLWSWVAGGALGLSVFAYTTGRLAALLMLAVVLVAGDRTWLRLRARLALSAPVVVAYAGLALYALTNADAVAGRFRALSISSDGASPAVVVVRLVRNLLTYESATFLFVHGDTNLRHSTGYGGVLLVVTLPLVLAGLVACIRRRGEAVPRLLLGGLLVAPLPAALTFDGTPHALRASPMLPLLLAVIAYGWADVLPLLRARRAVLAVACAAFLVDGGGVLWDLYARYPDRTVTGSVVSTTGGTFLATNQFQVGVAEAVERAHVLAGSHHLWLSAGLDEPAIQALVVLRPAPVAAGGGTADNAAELASVGTSVLDDAAAIGATARPGDAMVLAGNEQPPPRARVILTFTWTTAADHALPGGGDTPHTTAVVCVVEP